MIMSKGCSNELSKFNESSIFFASSSILTENTKYLVCLTTVIKTYDLLCYGQTKTLNCQFISLTYPSMNTHEQKHGVATFVQ